MQHHLRALLRLAALAVATGLVGCARDPGPTAVPSAPQSGVPLVTTPPTIGTGTATANATAPATTAPATSAPATSAPATSAPATTAPATSAPATSAANQAAPDQGAAAAAASAPAAPQDRFYSLELGYNRPRRFEALGLTATIFEGRTELTRDPVTKRQSEHQVGKLRLLADDGEETVLPFGPGTPPMAWRGWSLTIMGFRSSYQILAQR